MDYLIAGCGWLGCALGRSLVDAGHRVIGVRRDPAAAPQLLAAGIEPLWVDLASPDAASVLPAGVEAIVACQSAGASTAAAYREAYVDATATLLGFAALERSRRLLYIGSTGVFGQSDGGDVDETTTTLPRGETAAILVEAERAVTRAAERGVHASRLRLSGLYGPGRYGVVERVREGRLALGPGDEAWMNWCHLEDAVRLTRAAVARGRAGAVYHGSDVAPARRRDVVSWIAARLGIEAPGREDEPQRRRASTNRRILAERTRAELGESCAYPSFREGLEPCFGPDS